MKKIVYFTMLILLVVGVFAAGYEPTEFAKKYGSKTTEDYKGMNDYKTPFDFEKRLGVQRVTHYDPRVNFARIGAVVYLSPPGPVDYKGVGRGGYAPMYPRGTARISSTAWYGFPHAEIKITTKDIPVTSEVKGQFEAWVVDSESGYRLSLGTFTTLGGGVGELYFNADTYLDPYDWVEITIEPFDDYDVSPGPIVLLGRIPAPNYFDPVPKQAKMMTKTFSNY